MGEPTKMASTVPPARKGPNGMWSLRVRRRNPSEGQSHRGPQREAQEQAEEDVAVRIRVEPAQEEPEDEGEADIAEAHPPAAGGDIGDERHLRRPGPPMTACCRGSQRCWARPPARAAAGAMAIVGYTIRFGMM